MASSYYSLSVEDIVAEADTIKEKHLSLQGVEPVERALKAVTESKISRHFD